jgi:hypothetical protein
MEDRLIRLITNTIAPQSWSEVGGPGIIDYFPLGMALVVSQTSDVQDQIAELLTGLRRLQDDEVAVEVRVVTVSPEIVERLRRDHGIACQSEDASAKPQVTFLNGIQVFQFMEVIQQDRHTDIMQTPKLTLFNGQESALRIGDLQYFVTDVQILQAGGQIAFVPQNQIIPMGVDLGIQAVIGAYDRVVRVGLHGTITDLVSKDIRLVPVTSYITPDFEGGAQGQPVPFTQYVQRPELNRVNVDQALSIPAGQTAVLSGWTVERETCAAWRVALDEWAPGLKDWLQSSGTPAYSTGRTFQEIVNDLVKSRGPQPDNPGKQHATFGELVAYYVKDLLWNCGKQRASRTVLVLVTPHIIHNDAGFAAAVPVAATPAPAPQVIPAAYTEGAEKADTNFFDDVKKDIARLLADKYHQAIQEGRLAEAKLLAEKALSFDPACFDAE